MKHAHIIGIAGMGMGATALLLRQAGWSVSGSDEGTYPPMSTFLASQGIIVQTPYNPTNIPSKVDLFVVGRNAKLTEKNPEVAAALAHGAPVKNFAEVVGDLISNREVIAAVGSSGKSTTSSILAWCARNKNPDIGYFIGALPSGFDFPAALGTSLFFFIEGDEYPSGHNDAKSKFAHYHVHDVLITSIEYDHVNIFKTPDAYQSRFKELVESIPSEGMVVACADEPNLLALGQSSAHPILWYSARDTYIPWHGKDVTFSDVTTFTLVSPEGEVRIETQLLGEHNIQNIIGAAAMLVSKKIVRLEEFADAIRTFKGVRRRLDKLTTTSQIPLYEGFGSSREKARAAMKAMKAHFPSRRLVVLFEPHTFSWRNRATAHWYTDAFNDADVLFVYQPATQGSDTHEQMTQEDILEHLRAVGQHPIGISTPEDIPLNLTKLLEKDDVVLVLTSGNFDGASDALPGWLDSQYS